MKDTGWYWRVPQNVTLLHNTSGIHWSVNTVWSLQLGKCKGFLHNALIPNKYGLAFKTSVHVMKQTNWLIWENFHNACSLNKVCFSTSLHTYIRERKFVNIQSWNKETSYQFPTSYSTVEETVAAILYLNQASKSILYIWFLNYSVCGRKR